MNIHDSAFLHVGNRIHFYLAGSTLPVCGAVVRRKEGRHYNESKNGGSIIVNNRIIGLCQACDMELIRMSDAGNDVPDVKRFSFASMCAGVICDGSEKPIRRPRPTLGELAETIKNEVGIERSEQRATLSSLRLYRDEARAGLTAVLDLLRGPKSKEQILEELEANLRKTGYSV